MATIYLKGWSKFGYSALFQLLILNKFVSRILRFSCFSFYKSKTIIYILYPIIYHYFPYTIISIFFFQRVPEKILTIQFLKDTFACINLINKRNIITLFYNTFCRGKFLSKVKFLCLCKFVYCNLCYWFLIYLSNIKFLREISLCNV